MEDLSAADWLVRAGTDWRRLVTFGPDGFEAYGRLRFIPDPDRPGQAEADVELPDDHPPDIEQARTALRALCGDGPATTPIFSCVWDGHPWTFLDPEAARGPLVVLPHRSYMLFAGDLGDIGRWEEEFGGGHPCPPPAFAWPADHSWCFTSDVDPHWAGIGASSAAIEALTARTELDIVRACPDRAPLGYSG
ncbi:hypothetical protein V2S66_30850 [Streptomyces sp. V4-01]|uniref:DUF2716 domain-containing protein n=1 Tax=Actinacidiphila polyblastidii TaxID=3110430 RepID=A0ABU7PKI3_9ACTN|nr:hypothetical protein [Streptomyces sp. V4-01]